jgi:hypothetical protein
MFVGNAEKTLFFTIMICQFQRFLGQIDDVVHTEFVHDMGSVVLNGAYRAPCLKGDLFIAHALHKMLKDVVLSFAQDFRNRDILHRSFYEVPLGENLSGYRDPEGAPVFAFELKLEVVDPFIFHECFYE